MQRLQRQAGKLMKRSADKADVSTILQEFQVADQLLDTYMDAVRSFQNAWNQILAFQLGIAHQFETLYRPIHDAESNFNVETDPAALERATRFRHSYADLNNDLKQETGFIQAKLLQPAMDAKGAIAPLKKSIKKRENIKLDYEHFHSRHDHAKNKIKNAKDETAVGRMEADLASAALLYENADEQIRKGFPPVIDAIQALVPLLLKEQILLQHSLVGHLYTVLHQYCLNHGFPSPAPPMEEVIATWDAAFSKLRHEAEGGLETLSGGKAISQPFHPPITEKSSTTTGLSIRGRFAKTKAAAQAAVPQMKRTNSNVVEGGGKESPPPRPSRPGTISPGARPRIASSMSLQSTQSHQSLPEDEEAPPVKPPRPGPGSSNTAPLSRMSSFASETQSMYGTPLAGMSPNVTPGGEAWRNDRRGSNMSTRSTFGADTGNRPGPAPHQNDYFPSQRSVSTSSIASSIAAKKKPPPPPVKRRITGTDLLVVAMYDFAGQGNGDLSFREGDQIKVIKKTESTDDWWEGSLRGVSGSFPANYVQVP